MASAWINLPFGKSHLTVKLPRGARPTIIQKAQRSALADPHAAIRQALEAPIQAPPLKTLARNRRDACILICDITRPVPNHLFLRPMIEDLMAAGIPAGRILILIATGLHRPNEGQELIELVGDPWVLATVRLENHFARNDEDHVSLGVTAQRGTPVKIDRRFAEADLRIVTGLVEPHFMAGYSGGRKVVTPGIAHADTIRTIHSARFLEDPLATASSLEGNPLHDEQLQILRMIGEVYCLNVVLNDRRDLVHVNFGEIVRSHAEAVAVARGAAVVNLSRRWNTIVTSAAGYPLDTTYYQTIKGIVGPLKILQPEGTLIIASECSAGFGSQEFRESQARLVAMGPDAFLQSLLAKSLANIDEWQTEMQIKAMRCGKVQLHTPGLTAEERRLTAVELIESVDQAIAHSMERSGDADIAIVPEGPYVTPTLQEP